jgi:hypothetical protein
VEHKNLFVDAPASHRPWMFNPSGSFEAVAPWDALVQIVRTLRAANWRL